MNKTTRDGESSLSGDELLERQRGVTCDWHLSQARALVNFDRGRQLDSTLVYAALELRAAIEREFMELLGCLGLVSRQERT